MKQAIDTSLTFPEQFILLERFGRTNFREFRLKAWYWGEDIPQAVTQGLPPELYQIVYRSGEMMSAEINAGTLTISISEDAPGQFVAEGMDDSVHRFAEYMKSPPASPQFIQYPMMYHNDRTPGYDSLLRILYRGAEKANADMSVSTKNSGGRLTRITARWMLDTLELPLDILIQREHEWALYHVATRCAFESSDWFFEALGLLEQINTETGGYNNG